MDTTVTRNFLELRRIVNYRNGEVVPGYSGKQLKVTEVEVLVIRDLDLGRTRTAVHARGNRVLTSGAVSQTTLSRSWHFWLGQPRPEDAPGWLADLAEVQTKEACLMFDRAGYPFQD